MNLQEVLQKQMQDEIILIDIRDEDEYKKQNPIASINIPFDSIQTNPTQLLDFNTPIVLCCVSGRRSEMARDILKEHNIETESLEGGLAQLLN